MLFLLRSRLLVKALSDRIVRLYLCIYALIMVDIISQTKSRLCLPIIINDSASGMCRHNYLLHFLLQTVCQVSNKDPHITIRSYLAKQEIEYLVMGF